MKRTWLVALGLGGAALSFAQGPRYILRYTESAPLSAFLNTYGLSLEATVAGRPIHAVRDPQNRNSAALIQQIDSDNDGDVTIEIDRVVELPIRDFVRRQTAGISQLETLLGLGSTDNFFGAPAPLGFRMQNAVLQIKANLSWVTLGLGTGIVAVVDTGVDPHHAFFAGRLEPAVDWLTPGGNGSENPGLTQNQLAWINPTTTPILERRFSQLAPGIMPAFERSRQIVRVASLPAALGHGTMVAGAVRLVAPDARILPIRAFRSDGTGTLFDVIRSIHAAEDRGAKVINLSLNLYAYSPELDVTCEEVSDRGIILVASGGNDGLTSIPSYPASFSKVIGVGSVGSNNLRSAFSNAGPSVIDVVAPGEGLYLPWPGHRWAGGWGTSFSAPLVAGFASRILVYKPNATYSDLQSALNESVPLLDQNLGKGLLDVFNSLDPVAP